MPSCTLNPASEEVADFIYRFGSLQNNLRDPEQFPCVDYVSNDYAIFYTPLNEALPVSLERYPYYSIPGLFTLLDDSAMEASGILAALQTPALSNMGKGVLVGIVDSGIDYTSPAFRNEDGTTRILGIWDQTLPEDTSVPTSGVPDYYPWAVLLMERNLPEKILIQPLHLMIHFPLCRQKMPMATAPI